jgi:hypothetical protein
MSYWEVFMSLLCIYVGIVLPLRVGVDEVKPQSHRAYHKCSLTEIASPYKRPAGQVFAILDLTADFLFLLDLLANFVTARWVIVNTGREHWQLIDARYDLRQIYMWSGIPPQFWIDLLGVIPWHYIECFSDNDLGRVKVLRLLRLLKLLRLSHIHRLLQVRSSGYSVAVLCFCS